MTQIRPAAATLRMIDKNEQQTTGMIMIEVQNPKTKREYELEFYVATRQEQPLLGFKACRTL